MVAIGVKSKLTGRNMQHAKENEKKEKKEKNDDDDDDDNNNADIQNALRIVYKI